MQQAPTEITFHGILRGARDMAPVALFVIPFGIAFGVASVEHGLTGGESVFMSATVFAGTSQFAVLEIWGATVPLIPLVLLSLAVNARHALMGAALFPWLRHLTWPRRLAAVAVLSDANFAAGKAAYDAGERDLGVFVGAGLALWLAWVAGTGGGVVFGDLIADPRQFGLDVLMPTFFAALLVGSWNGRETAMPWLVAAFVSVVAYKWGPANWHVIAGALAGGTAAGLADDD